MSAEGASIFAPLPQRGRTSRQEQTQEPHQVNTDDVSGIATPGNPDPTWHTMVTTIKDAEDQDLMHLMACLINVKLDALKIFEGRSRLHHHDIGNVYLAMPYFVNIDKLTRRK